MVLLVYMGDVLIACNDKAKIDRFKVILDDKFKLKDLGDLKYFLGLRLLDQTKRLLFVKGNTHLSCLMMLDCLGVNVLKHL